MRNKIYERYSNLMKNLIDNEHLEPNEAYETTINKMDEEKWTVGNGDFDLLDTIANLLFNDMVSITLSNRI